VENIIFYENIKYHKEFNEEILNNVNLAIHVVDKHMNILAVNDVLVNHIKLKKHELINKNLYEVFPFLKEMHIDKEYEYVLRTGEVFQNERKIKYNGEEIYISSSKIPIKNKNEEVEKIITVIKDVTQQRRLEEELRDSYEELRKAYSKLKELFRIKDSFLSNVSHELNTPLTSIIGFTELLLDEDITEEQRHKLEIILRNSKRLSRLIKGLLDSSLIESSNLELHWENVCVHEVISNILKEFENIISIKNLAIHVEIPYTLCIQGDKERLSQVFWNLIDNAVKFTIKGEIRITTEEQDNEIHIKISDTGIGIPKDKLDLIFDRFYQLEHTPSTYHGAGLGLWVSRNIVEAHGGKIWAESKNRGSTFHILLPKRRMNAG